MSDIDDIESLWLTYHAVFVLLVRRSHQVVLSLTLLDLMFFFSSRFF